MSRQSYKIRSAGLALGLALAQLGVAAGGQIPSVRTAAPVASRSQLRPFLGLRVLAAGAAFFGAAYAATATTAASLAYVCKSDAWLDCRNLSWSLPRPVARSFIRTSYELERGNEAAAALVFTDGAAPETTPGAEIASAISDATERFNARRCTVIPQLGIGSVGLTAMGRF